MKPAVVALFVLFAAILIVVLHAKPTKTVGMTAKNVTYIKYTGTVLILYPSINHSILFIRVCRYLEGEHLAHNKTTDGLYRNQRSLLPGKIESSAR